MDPLEIIAIVFTVICVLLTIKQNIWCWLTGIVSIIAFSLLYFEGKLYSLLAIQSIFLIQSIYGWWNWGKGVKDKELPVTSVGFRILLHLGLTVVACGVFATYLDSYTDSSMPILDSLGAGVSLLANYYLTRKKLEAWPLWMLVNAILAGLFIHQEVYGLALLEFGLLVMSIKGFFEWNKNLNISRLSA